MGRKVAASPKEDDNTMDGYCPPDDLDDLVTKFSSVAKISPEDDGPRLEARKLAWTSPDGNKRIDLWFNVPCTADGKPVQIGASISSKGKSVVVAWSRSASMDEPSSFHDSLQSYFDFNKKDEKTLKMHAKYWNSQYEQAKNSPKVCHLLLVYPVCRNQPAQKSAVTSHLEHHDSRS